MAEFFVVESTRSCLSSRLGTNARIFLDLLRHYAPRVHHDVPIDSETPMMIS